MQLHTKTKAVSHKLTSNYIRLNRLNTSKLMLVDLDKSFGKVSWEANFKDVDYYSINFQMELGMSSSGYRNGNSISTNWFFSSEI